MHAQTNPPPLPQGGGFPLYPEIVCTLYSIQLHSDSPSVLRVFHLWEMPGSNLVPLPQKSGELVTSPNTFDNVCFYAFVGDVAAVRTVSDCLVRRVYYYCCCCLLRCCWWTFHGGDQGPCCLYCLALWGPATRGGGGSGSQGSDKGPPRRAF